MRRSSQILWVLTLLATFPATGKAQDTDSGSLAGDTREETLSDEDAMEATLPSARDERTLSPRVRDRTRRKWDPDTYELRLDSSGVTAAPPSPKKTDPRLLRSRSGLIGSTVAFGLGIAGLAGGIVLAHNAEAPPDEWLYIPVGPIILASFGGTMALGGLIGIAITSSRLSERRRELRNWASLAPRKRQRIQFDPQTARFVF